MLSQNDIRLSVARYAIYYSDDLRGMLKAEHCFLVGGEKLRKDVIANYNLRRGYALDIIADKLEREEYGREDREGKVLIKLPEQVESEKIFRIFHISRIPNEILRHSLAEKINLESLLGIGLTETKSGLLIKIPKVEKKIILII